MPIRSFLTLSFLILGLLVSACAGSRDMRGQSPTTDWSSVIAGSDDDVPMGELRAAAETGDRSAQHALAVVYADGRGVAQDMAQAVRWWRMASAQGYADAQNALALASANGFGVPVDRTRAIGLWRAAAGQGHALAQYNLGGHLVLHAQDRSQLEEGVRWLTKSADQGDGGAQFFLGNLYFTGEGVERDEEQARTLWRQAAASGHAQARAALAASDQQMRSSAAWHVATVAAAMPETVPAFELSGNEPIVKSRPIRSRKISVRRRAKTVLAPPPERPDVVAMPTRPRTRPSYDG